MALTLSELARLVDGDIVRGGLDLPVDGIASLDEAGPSELSFLGNEKYRSQYLATRAGAVIVPRGLSEGPEGCALIAADNPSLAFGLAVKHFVAARARVFSPGVHPRACVDDSARLDPAQVRIHAGAVVMAGAEIGAGTEIGPNCVIGEGVRIGRDCLFYGNVTVREHCLIGDRVILQPGAVIGSDGYGYELAEGRHVKVDQVGIVEIQDDVEIGANTTIDRARFGRTVIGEGSKIDNLVQIAHNVKIGRCCAIAAHCGISGTVTIGDFVMLGGRVGVGDHLTIGDGAQLAGNSGVMNNVPAGVRWGGFPAQSGKRWLREVSTLRKLAAGNRKEDGDD